MSMLKRALLLPLVLAACVPGTPPAREVWRGGVADNRTRFEARLLAAHNGERATLGLPPLTWNPVLAEGAKAWGESLAARDVLEHSENASRPGEGENLWKGTAGAYRIEEMMGHFLAEKRDFAPGLFPQVTRGASWKAVSHYTQIIWPTTREVGCAIVTRQDTDWLVCRYAPLGNVVGQAVGYPPGIVQPPN